MIQFTYELIGLVSLPPEFEIVVTGVTVNVDGLVLAEPFNLTAEAAGLFPSARVSVLVAPCV